MTPDNASLARKAGELRALHHGARPLVLPNAWDAWSARLVAESGFPAIATSSGAVAQSLGYPDDDTMPPDEAFGAVARVARAVDVPVTADIEAGYRLEPGEIARRLIGAGAVGCNLEDTDHHGDGVLVDAGAHAERLAAFKAAARATGVDVVLNARVDVFLRAKDLNDELLAEGIRRARIYVAAGADSVYPITLTDEAAIGEFVASAGAPVNILLGRGAPQLTRLAEIGVNRVSLGGGLYRIALQAAAAEIRRLSAER